MTTQTPDLPDLLRLADDGCPNRIDEYPPIENFD
jgi:hypothetical protein